MILYDYHLHTRFSADSNADVLSMVLSAIDRGLVEICFTDHIDNPAGFVVNDIPDYNSYFNVINPIKEKYINEISILFGCELSLSPRVNSQLEVISKDYPFDFIIGSSHEASGIFLGNNTNYYDGKSKKQSYTAYFEEILSNVSSVSCFDVYGHLDYISRYAKYEDTSLFYEDYSDIIDCILKQLILNGKGIELNASGFRYKIDVFHPSLSILKRYKELGGEILTIGSDAHSPQYVGDKFDVAYEVVKQAGFDYITTFKCRVPSFVKI